MILLFASTPRNITSQDIKRNISVLVNIRLVQEFSEHEILVKYGYIVSLMNLRSIVNFQKAVKQIEQ